MKVCEVKGGNCREMVKGHFRKGLIHTIHNIGCNVSETNPTRIPRLLVNGPPMSTVAVGARVCNNSLVFQNTFIGQASVPMK